MAQVAGESAREADRRVSTSPRLASAGTATGDEQAPNGSRSPGQAVIQLAPSDSESVHDTLYQTIRDQGSHLDRLAVHVEALLGRQRELRALLLEAQDHLVQRDAELEQLRARVAVQDAELELRSAQLKAEIAHRDTIEDGIRSWSEGQIRELKSKIALQEQQLKSFRSTYWWRLRQFIRRLLRG